VKCRGEEITGPTAALTEASPAPEPVATEWLKAFVGVQYLVGADEFFDSQDFSSNLAMLKG
jgi:hypothetical protein